MASRMNRILVNSSLVGLALAVSAVAWAKEIFPAIHDAPITVLVRSGLDGKPVPRAHLLAVGGYDEQDLRQRLWHEEALTDAEGKARLSDRISNLPFLQVWVAGAPLCQRKPRSESFSVDRVRREGLSTPNQCGFATSVGEPGTFNIFVKPSKKLLFPKKIIPQISENPAPPEVLLPGKVAALAAITPMPAQPAAAAPASVAPSVASSAPATAASQPAKAGSVPPPVSASASQPAPSPASGPTAAPGLASNPAVAPLIQTPAARPPVAAPPASQPAPPATNAAPKPTTLPQTKSGPSTAPAAAAKQPISISTVVLRKAYLRRVSAGVGARPSRARRFVGVTRPAKAPPKAEKQPAAVPAAAKPSSPAPPAPKIPVSLEAAPPPPPSALPDALPRSKPVASRRHAAGHRANPPVAKPKAGTAPEKTDQTKVLPAAATPAQKG